MRALLTLAVLGPLAACAQTAATPTAPPPGLRASLPGPPIAPPPTAPSHITNPAWRRYFDEAAALARAAGCGAIAPDKIDALLADLAQDRRHAGIPPVMRRALAREAAERGVMTAPRTCDPATRAAAIAVLDSMIASLPPPRRAAPRPAPANAPASAPDPGWQPAPPDPAPRPPRRADQLDL
jgi:hypothetical protein